MRFIDEARIYVKAGDGGRGCVSFRREKYVPRGGPNGGDGGKGGDVVVAASASHRTLLDLKFQQHHVARHGGHGEGSDRTGRSSEDVVIPVPVGTVVTDDATGEVLADLAEDGRRCVVAKGGRGGKGNAFFATATNRAPRYAQPGEQGQERWIRLELKLLADVGVIGFPNAGKSTLVSRVSAAKPKIADYPFTTLVPNLGVVRYKNFGSFVIADIPGLIEGAHRGVGLGTRFLRHVERTAVLIHLLDISGEAAVSGWHNFETINRELALYDPALAEKPQVVAIGKADLPETRERAKKEIDFFRRKKIEVFLISAVTGEGIDALTAAVVKKLKRNERERQDYGH
ncbi:MAG: GTPase ObgE [Pseudomonadota bacterium]|jgi:GTP-binding protein|nr:GTPase ObgE [Pseudomonadota bacterium]NLX30779.1 GTPase ObgE [Deltaproteobacteria bacterium]HNU84281.1 GTPase ObgE [Syntrophales bacterium]HNZ33784.1 GTPase ObgE [Syntrophales bacterium]HOF73376.1 GTPase ObgE [Syntrophales bacterium]